MDVILLERQTVEDTHMSITLVVVDDHEVVRLGLASLLADTEIDIVGQASGCEETVNLVKTLRPDVVLLDIRVGNGDGLDALDEIHREVPESKVVILSTYDNPTYIARAVALGASDYVLKGANREDILSSIRSAADGTSPLSSSVLHKVSDTMKTKKTLDDAHSSLTRRETQVLRHVALGLSNKEIGQSLEISIETVKEHVQNILRKISVNDRTQAAVWAVRKGFVD